MFCFLHILFGVYLHVCIYLYIHPHLLIHLSTSTYLHLPSIYSYLSVHQPFAIYLPTYLSTCLPSFTYFLFLSYILISEHILKQWVTILVSIAFYSVTSRLICTLIDSDFHPRTILLTCTGFGTSEFHFGVSAGTL